MGEMSQDDIDSLLNQIGADDDSDTQLVGHVDHDDDGAVTSEPITINDEEKATLKEISNISLGAAASNMAALMGKEIDVPAPELIVAETMADFIEPYEMDKKLAIHAIFTGGLNYSTVFVMKYSDAKDMANTMLGGEPDDAVDSELSPTQLDAFMEAMGQMMGASATSLSSVVSGELSVTLSAPSEFSVEGLQDLMPELATEPSLSIYADFRLNGGEAVYNILQVLLVSESKEQVKKLMELAPPESGQAPSQPATPAGGGKNVQEQPPKQDPVKVQPVSFSAFDDQPSVYGEENKNLDLVMDVTLNLTVELGKTEVTIKEVLELTRGSVIELDRIAGEPVDLLANGKLIAKGEVVVIEDNFGLRITSIVSPADRLRGL